MSSKVKSVFISYNGSNFQIRTGMVQVSDGKSRPRPARLVLTMDAVTVQREAPVPVQPTKDKNVPHARVSHSYIKNLKSC